MSIGIRTNGTRRIRAVSRNLVGVITVLALVGIYALYSATAQSVFFPQVNVIATSFWNTWTSSVVVTDALPSLARFAIGYTLAAVIGITLGVAIGCSQWLSGLLGPFLEFFRALPSPAMIPVAILIIGINSTMQVAIIIFGAIWPILVNAADGARSVPGERIDSAVILGYTKPTIIRRVIIPSALPQIFAGLRVGLSIAIIMVVVSELTASTNGLGYFLLMAQRTYLVPEMFATIILLGLIGLALNKLFVWFEHRLLGWHFEEKGGSR